MLRDAENFIDSKFSASHSFPSLVYKRDLFIWIEVDDFVADAVFSGGLEAIDRHNFMAVGGGD